MHLILSSDTSILPKIKLTAFQHEDITSFYNMDPIGVLKEVNKMDFAPNELCNYLEEKQILAESVIIISDNNLIGYNESMRLACHIRFHIFTSGLDKLPLTIVFDKIPNPIFDKSTMGSGEIQNFQYEEGFYFIDASDFFETLEDEAGQLLTVFEKNFNETIKNKLFDAEQLKTINILPSNQIGHHEISNLWGAVSLARNAGFDDNEIGYQIPQTLYFKYLSRKFSAHVVSSVYRKNLIDDALIKNHSIVTAADLMVNKKVNFSIHPYLQKKKILLVDDNAENGWEDTLECIFHQNISVITSLKYFIENLIIDNDSQSGKFSQNAISFLNGFDLIFFDLYMPVAEKLQPRSTYNGSIEIIKLIKTYLPHIPLIVFTASNKSWTMHEILEKGADGIYVKESPEYAADPTFSAENFRSFVNTVINCLEKYTILRPYWENIQLIANDSHFNSLPEKRSTKLKERIVERLEMFYGILKKGFEQRHYDKAMFHFSDYELAFMTLWSILSETSELFYDKIDKNVFTLIDKNGKQYKCMPIPNKNWKLVDNGKYLIKYDYEFESFNIDGTPHLKENSIWPILYAYNQKCFILRQKEAPFFKIGESTRVEASLEISLQIAFVLLAKFNLPEQHPILETLHRLNFLRNHLYLTHGSSIRDGFYSLLEIDKRKSPNYNITPTGDIKDLFELIAFLLTAKEIKLNF